MVCVVHLEMEKIETQTVTSRAAEIGFTTRHEEKESGDEEIIHFKGAWCQRQGEKKSRSSKDAIL